MSGINSREKMAQRTNSIQWRVTLPSAKNILLYPIKSISYFFSYAKPTPKSAIKKGSYHPVPFINASASVNPKAVAKKSIPISLHRGNTFFFLNHSILEFNTFLLLGNCITTTKGVSYANG